MRKPKYMSPSSLSLFEKDSEEYYIKHLADEKPPKIPQNHYMAVGSAFDAYCKSALYAALFGQGSNPDFTLDALFKAQVEPQNHEWGFEHGYYAFQAYRETGSFDELLVLLQAAKEPPQFEFDAQAEVGGVPLYGKPDCRFIHQSGAHVVLDWKVNGYCSANNATSPCKGYVRVRDGWDATQAKASRGAGKAHKLYMPLHWHGVSIGTGYLEANNSSWADQCCMYGWMMGEEVGEEKLIVRIDQLVCKPRGPGNKPLIRVANHAARISKVYQECLLKRLQDAWNRIEQGLIFPELNAEENAARCALLDGQADAINAHVGTELGDFMNEITRSSTQYRG